ncbi:AlbA family DNA-binding domain-containing protein [Sphingomonas kyeonggiensis]|uniref:Schlafen AlbA-2 domain-containing protein n=1 Tax=Sphingomonas kyeonggiensis TaxID=1268553 RepID=A0A7W6NVR8_9SPHN|nr:ATP-binding protein [Sphingomonas kyeonggiensis]MBB4097448.1 hypothetical protein [Sphingomonas kyeonggiensis]
MINKQFDLIEEADLLALVASKAIESRTLEFKREVANKTEAQVELVRDLAALANDQGGDFLIGVGQSKEGVANSVLGVEIANLDAKRLELENMIRDRTEPRLSKYQLRFIPVADDRFVIHFRVSASLVAPHAVRVGTHRNYFVRNGSGKHEMDVGELRDAFTAGEQLFPRLRKLHRLAIARSRGLDMPFRIERAPRCILTLVPRGYFREQMDLPITRGNALVPFRSQGYDFIPSLEGLLAHSELRDGKGDDMFSTIVSSYVLNHWGGYFDIGWTIGTRPESAVDGIKAKRSRQSKHAGIVSPEAFEQGILGMTAAGIAKLRTLGREGPWVVFVTVKGLGGTRLAIDENARTVLSWRKTATLGEVSIEEATEESLMSFARGLWLLYGSDRPAGRRMGSHR